MQGNAVDHDVKRKARVVKGREDDEKEEQQNKKDDHSYFRLVFLGSRSDWLNSKLISQCFKSKLAKRFIWEIYKKITDLILSEKSSYSILVTT